MTSCQPIEVIKFTNLAIKLAHLEPRLFSILEPTASVEPEPKFSEISAAAVAADNTINSLSDENEFIDDGDGNFNIKYEENDIFERKRRKVSSSLSPPAPLLHHEDNIPDLENQDKVILVPLIFMENHIKELIALRRIVGPPLADTIEHMIGCCRIILHSNI
jgi:hypothetical protein